MDVLIRQQDTRAQLASNDRSVTASTLNLGSDPDQEVRLGGEGVLGRHATIKATKGGCQVTCARKASIEIDGKTTSKSDLAVGDSFSLSGNRVSVVEAPSGFDLCLEIVPVSAESASVASAYKTDLTETRLGPRKLAWPLAIATLLISMLIPLGYFFLESKDSPLVEKLPFSDAVWTSGPLHEAHATLESNCTACHKKLFQKVTNASCEECHTATFDHITTVAQNEQFGIEMNGRCATCHKEHNEPVSTLVETANKLCTDCHASHELIATENGIAEEQVLGKIGDFTEADHVKFSVLLQYPMEETKFDLDGEWEKVRVPLPAQSENSQLVFNHEVHFDFDRVQNDRGEQLGCGDCHTLDVDGEHFDSITFETNCSNSGCHDLALGSDRLPHGYPNTVVAAIEGYYLRKFGNSNDLSIGELPSRNVDRRRLGSDRDQEKCTDSPFDCALALAATKVDQQFSKTGCVSCHLIDDNQSEDASKRFRVAPVKLTEDYHPNAVFDHLSHGILLEPGQKESIQGDAACSYCHDASKSVSSSDILMPSLASCTTCHDGQKVADNVPLNCTQCHGYHPPAHQQVGLGDISLAQ